MFSNHPTSKRNPVQNQDGAIVILVALGLTVIVGFGALVIDSGFQNILRSQLQNVADASAHAAALGLNLSDEGLERARAQGEALASMNSVGGIPYNLESNELEVGIWDFRTRTFLADDSDPTQINAVRTTPRYSLKPLMMDILSPDLRLNGQAEAIAARMPVASGCALPIAVPSCAFNGKEASEICGMDLVFNADGVDSAGWASLGGPPSAASIRSDISDASDGICNFSQDSTVEEDTLSLNNGAITNALKQITSSIESSPTQWDSSHLGSLPSQDVNSSIRWNKYGNTLQGLIYIYEDPRNCDGTKFSGRVALKGYAMAVFYDTVDNGNVSKRKIKAKIACNSLSSHRGSTSAGFYGVLGGVVLVQ